MFFNIDYRLAIAGLLLIAPVEMMQSASAAEQLKVAVGQRGAWDSGVSEIGQRAGIFNKHGLELDIVYTQGSGETSQAVLSGSVDVGVSVGMAGAISAYAKGAPIRVIGAVITGAADLFWYVRADSPINTLSDGDGKTLAYSTSGSSTQVVVNAFIAEKGIKAKPTATGGPPGTLTMVMSGQIDIGWGLPPVGLDLIDQKKIRVIASGNDTSLKDQTPRVLATTAAVLKNRGDAIRRYMDAYRETVRFMNNDDAALKIFSDWVGISPAIARRSRDDFYPKGAIDPDKIVGLDQIMRDAVAFKYISDPLTQQQLSELIQIPPPSKQ
jgi:NitT/TauT family transport system substrate-binding protein